MAGSVGRLPGRHMSVDGVVAQGPGHGDAVVAVAHRVGAADLDQVYCWQSMVRARRSGTLTHSTFPGKILAHDRIRCRTRPARAWNRLTAVQGVYRRGRVELGFVTFLEPDVIDLREQGIDETQAADLRARLTTFVEDWSSPEMDLYANYDLAKASLQARRHRPCCVSRLQAAHG